MSFGWTAHPDAETVHTPAPVVLTDADCAAPVVRMGARCDLRSSGPDPWSAKVTEYVELATGRIVVIRADRGFSVSAVRSTVPGGTPENTQTTDEIIEMVLGVVLPDEADDDAWFDADDNHLGESHGHDELAELARSQGVRVTGDELRRLPYDVVLGGELLAHCGLA